MIYRYIPIAGGKWKKLFELEDVDYDLEVLNFISDKKLAVLTNKETDKVVLREFDIKTQSIGKIIYQNPEFDLSGASFLNDGSLNSVSYYKYGINTTQYFDKSKERFSKKLEKTFVNQSVVKISSSLDESVSLYYTNGSANPGAYLTYSGHGKNGKFRKLFQSYPDLEGEKFSPSKRLEIRTNDGEKLEGFLTLPVEGSQDTLLVMPHGGPIGIQEHDRFNKEVQYYASRGFAVLRVNFRGSSGFGKKFLSKGVGEFGKLIEEDISAAVNLVKKEQEFKNICAVGASYGGYSAAMLAIKHPGEYDCVVGAFGIYDLPLLYNTSNLWADDEEFKETLSKVVGEYSVEMKDYSPVYLYKQLKAPILLIAGKDDEIAYFEHTNRFKYVLNKRKHKVETMFYADTKHGHATWSAEKHQAAITYDFLFRTLGLKRKKVSEMTEVEREAYGKDYLRIGTGYYSKDIVEDDVEKAITNFQKASNFGLYDAQYVLAKIYYDDRLVGHDIRKTIENLTKSKNKHKKNLLFLAEIYMDGLFLERDWKKALSYLDEIEEKMLDPDVSFAFAKYYCAVPGAKRDITSCLAYLDIELYRKNDEVEINFSSVTRKLSKTLSWLLANANWNKEEKKQIAEFIMRTYKLTSYQIEMEKLREGGFMLGESTLSEVYAGYEIVQTPDYINPLQENGMAKIGASFELNIPGMDTRKDKVAIAAVWSKLSEDGEVEAREYKFYFGAPKYNWYVTKEVKNILEPSRWRLEIRDIKQNIIYSKVFNIVSVSEDAEIN